MHREATRPGALPLGSGGPGPTATDAWRARPSLRYEGHGLWRAEGRVNRALLVAHGATMYEAVRSLAAKAAAMGSTLGRGLASRWLGSSPMDGRRSADEWTRMGGAADHPRPPLRQQSLIGTPTRSTYGPEHDESRNLEGPGRCKNFEGPERRRPRPNYASVVHPTS